MNQPNPKDIRYPSFILGVAAAAVKKILTPNILDPQTMWYFRDVGADNLWELSDDKPNSDRINAHLVIRQRQGLEKDPSVLQILPYTMIGWVSAEGDVSVSTYYRKKGHGEERLEGNMSFGWGGHIEVIDFAWKDNGDLDLAQTILNNIAREKGEECIFTDTRDGSEVSIHAILDVSPLRPQGFIVDDRNDVGRHHLAVVNLIVLPNYITVAKREHEHLQGEVMSIAQIIADIDAFEPWSEIIVRSAVASAEGYQENVAALQEQHKEADYHRLGVAAGQASSPADTPSNVVRETVMNESIIKETAQ